MTSSDGGARGQRGLRIADLPAVVEAAGLDCSPRLPLGACVLRSERGGCEIVVFSTGDAGRPSRVRVPAGLHAARLRWHPTRPLLAMVVDAVDIAIAEAGSVPEPLRLGLHEVVACEWIPGSLDVVIAARPKPERPLCVLRARIRGGPAELLAEFSEDCTQPAVDPSGARLVVLAIERGVPADIARGRTLLIDLRSGEITAIDVPGASACAIAWSLDGRRLAAITRVDGPARWSAHHGAVIVNLDRGTIAVGPPELNLGHPLRSARSLAWHGDEILIPAPDRGAMRLFRVARGSATAVSTPDAHVLDFARTSDAQVIVVDGWPSRMPALRLLDPGGRNGRIVDEPNERLLDRIDQPRVERFNSRAPDGLYSETLAVLPAAERPPAPALLQLHGGPHASSPSLSGSGALLPLLAAADGLCTLMPNPRGSTGYGADFQNKVVGDWGGGDVADVLGALEQAIAIGLCSEHAPVVAGWSYGGFLGACLLVRTARFAAGVLGAPVTDLASFVQTTDAYEFALHELGMDPGQLLERSPLRHVRGPVAPTLLLHAVDDPRCPLEQSRDLMIALRAHGTIVELVTYLGDEHAPGRPADISDVLARTLAWISRHRSRQRAPLG